MEGSKQRKTFFANYISVVLMIIIYAGSKTYFMGPLLIQLAEMDLDSLFIEDDIINAESILDKGIFRSFFLMISRVLLVT